jgi:hypothetical protein
MSMDFFDRLEIELTRAAARETEAPAVGIAGQPDRRRRSAWASRPLLIAVLGLVVAGTAVAAVARFTGGEASRPLQGTHRGLAHAGAPPSSHAMREFCAKNPGTCPGSGPLNMKYKVSLTPFLATAATSRYSDGVTGAGRVGWCAIAELSGGAGVGQAAGCAPSRSAQQSARIAGGGFGTAQDRVSFVVVDQRVAAVRLRDGRVVRTRADASLPDRWRAAVWRGGTDTATTVELLDAGGALLPKQGRIIDQLAQAQRAGPNAAATYKGCAITSRTLRVRRARTIIDPPRAVPDVAGHPFLICATAGIGNAPDMTQALVLVDARAPGTPPANLPGAAPSRTDPGIVEVGDDVSAKRIGDAWLVVTSSLPGASKGFAERRRALAALKVGP